MELKPDNAQAIRATRDNYIALDNLSTALDRSGQTERTMECFAQALRIKPDHPEAHINLAAAPVQPNRNATVLGADLVLQWMGSCGVLVCVCGTDETTGENGLRSCV